MESEKRGMQVMADTDMGEGENAGEDNSGFYFLFSKFIKKRVGLLPGPGPLPGVNPIVSLVHKAYQVVSLYCT